MRTRKIFYLILALNVLLSFSSAAQVENFQS